MPEKRFLAFNPAEGFPTGNKLHYLCTVCGGVLPSRPDRSIACACRNVAIDVDAGRMSVRDEAKLRLFEWQRKVE